MATYLDKLSALMEDGNEDDALRNEHKERLVADLFNYEPFVVMTMNWRHHSELNVDLAKDCILHIFDSVDGLADIKQCCVLFAECLDNIELELPMLTPMMQELASIHGTH